jgi:hypothetical protein
MKSKKKLEIIVTYQGKVLNRKDVLA